MLSTFSDSLVGRVSPRTTASLYRTTPKWLGDRIAAEHFRRTVRWAGKHSPFYRKAFADRGISPGDVRGPADLGDFFTTPDDIVARPADFICRPPSIVFESSGTSGKNKQVYYGRDELETMGRVDGRRAFS